MDTVGAYDAKTHLSGLLDRVDALVFTAPATWAYGTFIAGFGG